MAGGLVIEHVQSDCSEGPLCIAALATSPQKMGEAGATKWLALGKLKADSEFYHYLTSIVCVHKLIHKEWLIPFQQQSLRPANIMRCFTTPVS